MFYKSRAFSRSRLRCKPRNVPKYKSCPTLFLTPPLFLVVNGEDCVSELAQVGNEPTNGDEMKIKREEVDWERQLPLTNVCPRHMASIKPSLRLSVSISVLPLSSCHLPHAFSLHFPPLSLSVPSSFFLSSSLCCCEIVDPPQRDCGMLQEYE